MTDETLRPERPIEVDEAARRPDHVLGKFVLVKKLGQGGFGTVWKAWQVDLSRFVALKFIHSDDAEDRERFTREARLAAQLHHPNIAPIYEVGEADGRPFLAMQLIDGASLEKEKLSPREALVAMRDAARAVAHAHQNGIIHRDLKPQNLMRARDGQIFVTDFGLAKSLRAASSLSVSGMVLGTPAYMPPEQAEGAIDRIGPHSDVYALGATLYHLLTGRAPFAGSTPVEILGKVANQDPPSPRSVVAEIHLDIESIVLKCLEKDPSRRYASARDLVDEIDRYLEGRPILARPASAIYRMRRWCGRHKFVTTLVGLLLATALAFPIYIFSRRASVQILRIPPGARVWIDDPDVGLRSSLSPGLHFLYIEHPDYEPFEHRFVLRRGDWLSLEPKLVRKTGRLNFTCSIEGAKLSLQGADRTQLLFTAPTRETPLPTGRYTGEVVSDGAFSVPVRFDVKWNVTEPLYVHLQAREMLVTRVEGRPLTPPVVLDLDADGVPDIVAVVARTEARYSLAVVAISGTDGRILWEHLTTGQTLQEPRILDLDRDGDPDLILVTFAPESLLVLDGPTGEVLWRRDGLNLLTARPLIHDMDGDGYPDFLARIDSILNVSDSHDTLVALSYSRQAWLWNAAIPRPDAANAAGRPWPDTTFAEMRLVSPQLVVVPLARGSLCGFRPGGTTPLWTVDFGEKISVTPAVDEAGRTFVALWTGRIACVDDKGTVLWEKNLGYHIGVSPILVEGALVVITRSGTVSILDPASGEEKKVLKIEGAGLHDPTSADLDGDGVNELVVPANESIVAVNLSVGSTTSFPFASAPLTPAVADVDGDGVADLVAVSEKGIHVHRTRPRAGYWRTPGPTAGILKSGRLWCRTKDGATASLDLTTGRILRQTGRSYRHIPYPAGRDSIAYEDPQGKILLYDAEADRELWSFDAAGLQRTPPAIPEAASPPGLVEENGGRAWRLEISGPGGGKVHMTYFPGSPTPMRFADLNADGANEVISANYFGTAFALDGRNGALLWRLQTGGPVWAAPAFADLDRDGDLDVVIASSDHHLYAIEGRTGALLWAKKMKGPTIDEPVIADLDGDGIPDLVVKVARYRLTGVRGSDGHVQWEVALASVGSASLPCVSIDADKDGAPDLVAEAGEGVLRCDSVRNKRLLWVRHVSREVGSPVAAGDAHLLVPYHNGREQGLAILRASDGKILSRIRTPAALDRPLQVEEENGAWVAYVFGEGVSRVPIDLTEHRSHVWNPHHESGEARRSSARWQELGELRGLVRNLRGAASTFTGGEFLDRLSRAEIPPGPKALWSGIACEALGRNAEAITHFEEAIRLGADDPDVGLDLASIYLQSNQREAARSALLRQWQRHTEATAEILESPKSRIATSVRQLMTALLDEVARGEAASGDASGAFARGCARMLKARPDDAGAHADFTEVIRVSSWNGAAHARRGVVSARLGRPLEAGQDLVTAERLGWNLAPLRATYSNLLRFSLTMAAEWWTLDAKLRLSEVEVRELLTRAKERARSGDAKGAAADLDRARRERPDWQEEIERLRREILPDK